MASAVGSQQLAVGVIRLCERFPLEVKGGNKGSRRYPAQVEEGNGVLPSDVARTSSRL